MNAATPIIRRSFQPAAEGFMRWLQACLCVALLTACGAKREASTRAGFEDLSGTYSYTGLGEFEANQFPNPLIDFSELQAPTTIEFKQESNHTLVVSYSDRHGKAVTRSVAMNDKSLGTSFKAGTLTCRREVPITGVPILPGSGKHFRGVRVYRATDGDLRVVGFFTEKGRILHVFPFTDHYDFELVLKRVAS
jgi:hypothetical protein